MFPGIDEGRPSEMPMSWRKRPDRKDVSRYFTECFRVLTVQLLRPRSIILSLEFSIPTPQIPPPRQADSAPPIAADGESDKMSRAPRWFTEAQRLPLTTRPFPFGVEMGIN